MRQPYASLSSSLAFAARRRATNGIAAAALAICSAVAAQTPPGPPPDAAADTPGDHGEETQTPPTAADSTVEKAADSSRPRAAKASVVRDFGKVTINLRDADIGTLIATVSEVTGKNFIVDPRVKGKVTVVSASPMDARAVYATFLSVLEVSGYAAIPAGSSIKIVPEANAKTEGGSGLRGDAGDDIVTRVIDVPHGSATQLVALLRPLVAQSGHLAAYAPSNSLIMSDRAANVERVARLVAQMQQNGDAAVEIVPLENAVADEIVKLITSMTQNKQGDGGGGSTATLAADVRTNTVLVGGIRSERETLIDLIHRLDRPSSNVGDTQVVFLHYADATNLASLLMGYMQQQASKSSTGSILGSSGGSKSSGGGGSSAPAASGSSSSASASTLGGSGSSSNSDLRVLADKDTNSLVITAPPKLMQQARAIVTQLDIRRAQVLVEAIVAEVTGDNTSDIGVDWVAYNPNSVAAAGITNSSTTSALSTAASALSGGSSSSEAALSAAASLLGSGGTMLVGTTTSNGSIYGALIKALQSNTKTNILSTPSLVTLDNQEAKIEVGQSVPEVTGSYTSTGSTSSSVNPFQTIDRQDIGLKLGITPTIGEGSTIRLKLEFENSTVVSGSAGSSDLVTSKRTVSNMVNIEGGQILVIGGLIDDQVSDKVTAIPLLSSIPVLGNLFKSRSVEHTKRNLMIFIRPVILRSRDDGNYYTRSKYIAAQQAQREASNGSESQAGGKSPVMDDYPDDVVDKVKADAADKPSAPAKTEPATTSGESAVP